MSQNGILFNFDAKDGQGILQLENDQNKSYAYRIAPDPMTNELSYRFEVRGKEGASGDSQRSELKIHRKNWHADLHKDYWYGFKMMLDPSWKTKKCERWCVLAQWHDIPDGIDTKQLEEWRPPILSLCAINDKWKILYRYDPDKISNTSRWSVFDKKSLGNPVNAYCWQAQIDTPDTEHWFETSLINDIGKWVNWIFHVRWEYDNSAVLEVWKNDVKVISSPGHPVGYNDDQGPTSKFGIYRSKPGEISGSEALDRIVYINKYIVGNSDCNYNTISNLMNS